MVQYTLDGKGATKESWNLYSSLCRLLITSHSEEDSLRILLSHISLSLCLQMMLSCCSADQRLLRFPYFFIAAGIFHETYLSWAAQRPIWPRGKTLSPSLHQSTQLILSLLGVTTTAEGYGGRQFVCVFQWVSIPSKRMLHHCRYRSLQTISQMLIEVIKATASRKKGCRW